MSGPSPQHIEMTCCGESRHWPISGRRPGSTGAARPPLPRPPTCCTLRGPHPINGRWRKATEYALRRCQAGDGTGAALLHLIMPIVRGLAVRDPGLLASDGWEGFSANSPVGYSEIWRVPARRTRSLRRRRSPLMFNFPRQSSAQQFFGQCDAPHTAWSIAHITLVGRATGGTLIGKGPP